MKMTMFVSGPGVHMAKEVDSAEQGAKEMPGMIKETLAKVEEVKKAFEDVGKDEA